jgi:hypothetical protein
MEKSSELPGAQRAASAGKVASDLANDTPECGDDKTPPAAPVTRLRDRTSCQNERELLWQLATGNWQLSGGDDWYSPSSVFAI